MVNSARIFLHYNFHEAVDYRFGIIERMRVTCSSKSMTSWAARTNQSVEFSACRLRWMFFLRYTFSSTWSAYQKNVHRNEVSGLSSDRTLPLTAKPLNRPRTHTAGWAALLLLVVVVVTSVPVWPVSATAVVDMTAVNLLELSLLNFHWCSYLLWSTRVSKNLARTRWESGTICMCFANCFLLCRLYLFVEFIKKEKERGGLYRLDKPTKVWKSRSKEDLGNFLSGFGHVFIISLIV